MARVCPVCGGNKRVETGGEWDMWCNVCNGTGWVEVDEPAPTGGDLGMLAMIALGAAGLMALILAIGIWMEADGVLRPILESLPGDSVAETANDHGNPALIAALTVGVVLAGAFALSRWRRGLIRDYLRGESSYPVLFSASVARMIAIFAGIALIPVAAAIADGQDLRAGDDPGTVLDAAWRFLVAGAGVLAFSFFGLRRTVAAEQAKPPPPNDSSPVDYR